MMPNLYNETMIKGVFLCFKTVFMRTETLKKHSSLLYIDLA